MEQFNYSKLTQLFVSMWLVTEMVFPNGLSFVDVLVLPKSPVLLSVFIVSLGGYLSIGNCTLKTQSQLAVQGK